MNHFLPGRLSGLAGSRAVASLAAAAMLPQIQSHRIRVRRTLRRLRAASRRRMVRLENRAQTAQRLAELGTLTGGLAHEIKNPLSTVLLNLQLLQEDLDPKDPAHSRIISRLQTVTREASRLRD